MVHVPAGTVHAFHFAQGGGGMLKITERGRAVEMFRAVGERVPPGPPDVPTLLGVLSPYGVTVHGTDVA